MDGRICVLCFRQINNHTERYLVHGKGKFDAYQELQRLPFDVKCTSSFICKECVNKLKKRKNLTSQLKDIDCFLENLHLGDRIESDQKRSASDNNDTFVTPKKLRTATTEEIELVQNVQTSTPDKRSSDSSRVNPTLPKTWPVSPVEKQSNCQSTQGINEATKAKNVDVSVRVQWPSKNSERKLPQDLESLGKMLVRGTYKQIAHAAWKNASVRKEITELMTKDIEKETSHLCSKKEPSCLRKTDKESMSSFTMEKVSDEIKERAPLFHLLLSAACVNSKSKAKQECKTHFGAVAMAAAVCLRNRSKYMIAAQLLLTIFLYHSNWLSTIARLSALRVAVSHTFLYKKLDEYGKDHTKSITDAVTCQGQYMAHKKQLSTASVQAGACTAAPPPSSMNSSKPDVGRKITFDNIDYRQEVHHMTEEHQNIDNHYVTVMSTENRVHGNELSDKPPETGIFDMENGKCLPSVLDNTRQRDNYIALTERIISNSIPCLHFLSDVATTHIPHQYSKEMKNVSDTTFLGMIYENENDADGILNILRSLHQYVPFYGDDEERQYGEQGIVGDQLSVERAVNGHVSLANGFTPEERVEGLHFEVADWHAGNKFLEVAFTNLYNPSSAADKCTMYSDRNLVNRRNVKGDVSAAANPCRRFFQLEVEARIIAAALKVLGLNSLDPKEKPTQNVFPNKEDAATKQEKQNYLHKIATLLVDEFVIDQQRNINIMQSVQVLEHEQQAKDQEVNADGRYPCRSPGCSKTFAHDGKLRREHEAKHNPPVVIDGPSSSMLTIDSDISEDKRDDMLAYQKALLDYGMLILNFWDAISEGDGGRILRCWKFFLMYLKHQGGSATKYSLEALYLMFQVYALLSPQASHRLVWDRVIKIKHGSCNIPLDLLLEFFNKAVKEAVKKLGPSASQKSLDRICNSLGMTTAMMKLFDSNLSVFRRSGKHIQKSTKNDTEKLVNELVVNKAFTCTPGRKYIFYAKMKPSILCGFNLQKMYTWINDHKKHMVLHRRAR